MGVSLNDDCSLAGLSPGAALARGPGVRTPASTRTTHEIRANPMTSAGGRGLREGKDGKILDSQS
jgi:hypothetical protein